MIKNFWRLVFVGVLIWSVMIVGFLIYKTKYQPLKINLSVQDVQKYREWKPPKKGVVLAKRVKTGDLSQKPQKLATGDSVAIKEAIRSYIKEKAAEKGVDPRKALFIAEHESQFNPNAIGDSGISFGVWQFNLRANPHIPKECALDYKCSTEIAMNWLADGKENSWSVWRMRNLWYNEK